MTTAVERLGVALDEAKRRVDLGAFWALDDEQALAAAAAIDAGRGRRAAPLAGIAVAVKDLFDQRGLPTTGGVGGSHEPASRDAVLVTRLRRSGAVPIGKTAMDQLGCTTGGQAPGFPPCLNPLDEALSPGGSSSGSAVAVAAGIVPLALGTDTAGSARIPAAYCGVVGFKPARRSLPRRGVIPVMPGFDTPALLARSVPECVRAYAALIGHEPETPSRPLRLGLLADLLDRSEAAVAAAVGGALARLGPDDASVEAVELEWQPRGLGQALAYELAANWAQRVEREPDRFSAVVRETIEFGSGVGAERYRRVLVDFASARSRLRRRLGGFDALVSPTVPIPAPRREDENVATSSAFTRLFNGLDWPAISIPLPGPADVAPIALQVAGMPSRLGAVLATAQLIEDAVAP